VPPPQLPPAPQNPAGMNQTIINQLKIADAVPLIAALEQKRQSRVICLTYNNDPPGACNIAFAATTALQEVLSGIGKVPRLDLLLRTTGGAAEVPWRIVTLLREFSNELGVIVCGFALSGGCHIAIAADELVMGPFAVLGPVDPTRNHPLLPKDAKGEPIPTSVQDLKHCIQFIREQLGDTYPQQNLAQIISELFKYINPLALGALEQTYNLSRLITKKVLETHKEKLSAEKITQIVDFLSGQYFSHAFFISRNDVEKDLGLGVTKPDDELSRLIEEVEAHSVTEFQKAVPLSTNAKDPLIYVGALMQTTGPALVLAVVKKADGTVVAEPWVKFR
jgi:Serine dehydrogenase proteinase